MTTPLPTGPDLHGLLTIAVDAAQQAGALLLDRFGLVQRVETKTSATDPVGEADRASEALLVATLLAARPDDGLLGEEGADRPARSGLRWVIDPLDGTVNYLYGHAAWAVSVACEQRADAGWEPVVGVVLAPLRSEVFTAVSGGGAWLGERRLRVNDPVALERSLVSTGFAYLAAVRARQATIVARVLPEVGNLRRIGSAALDLCDVAAGRVDGYYEDTAARWDWAAGALIATEAGALVSLLSAPGGAEGVVAAGPALHAPLHALVSGTPAALS